MAKTPKTINVQGLSIENILNMDLSGLKESDLRAVASRMVSASNKRLRRLQSNPTGKISPILNKYQSQFSIKGKNYNQVQHQVAQMREFLSAKTSTLKGWKKVKKSVEKRVGGELNEQQYNKLWKVYNSTFKTRGGEMSQYDSKQLQQMLYSMVSTGRKNKSISSLKQEFENALNVMYEEMQTYENQLEGVMDGDATTIQDYF